MTYGNRKRCLSKRKDTNFKANHNSYASVAARRCDVCLSAKIRILKQITTMDVLGFYAPWMFV